VEEAESEVRRLCGQREQRFGSIHRHTLFSSSILIPFHPFSIQLHIHTLFPTMASFLLRRNRNLFARSLFGSFPPPLRTNLINFAVTNPVFSFDFSPLYPGTIKTLNSTRPYVFPRLNSNID